MTEASQGRPSEEGSAPVSHALSFENLYLAERSTLLGLAIAVTGDAEVAEELVQDAFLQAHRHWERVSQLDRPGAWLRRVVTNLATSRGRRRVIEARGLGLLGRRAEHHLEIPEDVSEFWRLVRSLPRRQAQVVALYYFEDRSTQAIAESLDVSEGTVRATLAQARRSLAAKLQFQIDETKDVQ